MNIAFWTLGEGMPLVYLTLEYFRLPGRTQASFKKNGSILGYWEACL
ncbi:MAG: hypothetical protein GTO22_07330 [Gemmatimonadales bacterium]|nr:hypothetical protein [Gemmatimonadales bacterium]